MVKHYLFTVILIFSVCLNVAAQEIEFMDIEGPTYMFQCDLRDLLYPNGASAAPHKANQFVNPGDAVVNYRDRITNMPLFLLDFMDEFVEAGRVVLDGGSNWLSDPTQGTLGSKGYYHPLKEVTGSVDFTFPPGSSDDVIRKAAQAAYGDVLDAEKDVLDSFMSFAFFSLNHDHPEFFWINSFIKSGCIGGSSISFDRSSGTGTANYTITSVFMLRANGFDIRTNGVSTYDFRDPTNLANGVRTFKNSIQTILSECQGSRYDKLLAAHDWLTLHNCYNPYAKTHLRSEIGDTPWTSFSALEGNNGRQAPVCEGYARALKVLCDAMDIPCVLLAGKAYQNATSLATSHMWTYVQMEDGKWYCIDPTWDDPSIGGVTNVVSGQESHNWFLVGSTTDMGDGFTFIQSHPEQWFYDFENKGSYSWDLLPGPELSPVAWTSSGEESDPFDLNGDGSTDETDIQIMAESILNDDGSVEDFDGNGRISIGDLVRLIAHYLSE